MTTYHCKFIGGPMQGKTHMMSFLSPEIHVAISHPQPVARSDAIRISTIASYPTFRYELRNVMGHGEHEFCLYGPTEATTSPARRQGIHVKHGR